MTLLLQGRHLLITGAGSGIGRATAQLFASHGARLALLDRNAEAVHTVARELGAFHAAVDVADEAQVNEAVQAAASAMGDAIDGVVNAAGMAIPAPLAETRLADWNRVLAVNLTGPFLLCRAALPWLQRSSDATIVNVSSGSALLPVGLAISSYVASKSAIIGLTRALARSLGPLGIRVNAVSPGSTETAMTAEYDEQARRRVGERTLVGRLGRPEEIAAVACCLISDSSSYVSGHRSLLRHPR